MLSPLVEEAVRRGVVINEIERGRLGGFLWTGNQVMHECQIAPGAGDFVEATAAPDDGSNGQTTES